MKKRNKQDLTLRNRNAYMKHITKLNKRVFDLEERLEELTLEVRWQAVMLNRLLENQSSKKRKGRNERLK